MGMFGAKPRNPYDTPGYGIGEMGALPPETMPENSIQLPANPFEQQPQMQQPMGQQPGMFGAPQSNYGPAKGTLSEKLMALGGIFGNLGGQRNDAVQQYFATLEGRREEARKAQLAEAARYAPQEVGGNIVRMKPDGTYETMYSAPQKPANNDTMNDYEFYRQKFGPEFADNWLKFNAANVRQPDGTYVSAATGWGGAAPLPALPPGVTIDAPTTGGAAPKGPATFR